MNLEEVRRSSRRCVWVYPSQRRDYRWLRWRPLFRAMPDTLDGLEGREETRHYSSSSSSSSLLAVFSSFEIACAKRCEVSAWHKFPYGFDFCHREMQLATALPAVRIQRLQPEQGFCDVHRSMGDVSFGWLCDVREHRHLRPWIWARARSNACTNAVPSLARGSRS